MGKITAFFHNLFIPKESNNFRAKVLHPDFLSSYLVLAIVLTFTFKLLGNGAHNVLGFATDVSTEKLLTLTNTERTKNELQPLAYNTALSEAAAKKAEDMFAGNYWSHFGPNGETPWNFILASGYRYEYAGENLAKNFLFSDGVVTAWMNSPTHRENILRRDYTDVGFAIKNGLLNGEETTLVVQMFGKPLAQVDGVSDVKKIAAPEKAPVVTSGVPHESSPFPVFATTYKVQLAFLVFLILALIFDFYYAFRSNVTRISGRNIAHVIFIGFIIIGIIILTKGVIL